MAIQINGSTGVSGVNGTGTNPVYSGGDSDTGIFFPALGQVAITTNGVQRLLITETGDIQSASVLSFPGGSASAPSIAFTGDTDTGLYSPSANSVAISTGGSGRLFVDASGNVGVAAAPSAFGTRTAIQLNGSTSNWFAGGVNGATLFSRNIYNDGSNKFIGTGFASIYYQSTAGDHVWERSSASGTAGAAATMLEALRITSAGLVGLGTSSPGAGLHVANVPIWAGATTASTSGVIAMYGDGNNGTIEAFAGNNSSTKRNICLAPYGGSVGIGTTDPAEKLEVRDGNIGLDSAGTSVGDRTTERFYKRTDNGSTNGMAAIGMNGTGTNGFLGEIKFYTGLSDVFNTSLSERARIDSSGRLLIGTSTSTSTAGAASTVQVASSNPFTGLRWNAGANPSTITLGQSRGAAPGTLSIASNNDSLSRIQFVGDDGTQFVSAASITAAVDGTPGTNDMPGRLVFSTTEDGASSPTERLRITSAGNVGIGTTSPSAIVHSTVSSAGVVFRGSHNNSGIDLYANDATGEARITATRLGGSGGKFLSFYTDTGTGEFERARIDSFGRLLVGTSSARSNFFNASTSSSVQVEGTTTDNSAIAIIRNSANSSSPLINFAKSRSTSVGGNTLVADGDQLGAIWFQGADGTEFVPGASIQGVVDGTPGTNDMPGRLVFSTTADGASSPTERMRIANTGRIGIGTTDTGGSVTDGTGVQIHPTGYAQLIRSSGGLLALNRRTDDGDLITFFQDNAQEGSITVSGTTVSYNGAHLSRWSQLPSGVERTEILRGTVLSNIDEMCEWGDEDNEQLNRMKVSDVEGDKNVSGVFQAWDDDDDTYTNDFYCAMTGDFIIRIAQGVTVERGDLLMSAGDGTAKPQDDDIIRSKTIAKVTSTNVSCTYEDGSYCVPCVLMAC